MHHVADMDADLDFDPTVGGDVMIALGQGPLDLDGTLRRFQRAVELDQERVANGFDLGPVKTRKDLSKQSPMFFQQSARVDRHSAPSRCSPPCQ